MMASALTGLLAWLFSLLAPQTPPAPPAGPTFVGSVTCATCHAAVYARWSTTRMANVIRDPKAHPNAIIPDFTTPDPLLTFTKEQVAFVYGSKWKQRYFTRIDGDYLPLPAQWDVTQRRWRPYEAHGPTSEACDGCHSVNFDVRTRTVTEWNVGCERCHGPGSAHVATPSRATIVNPARLDPVRANDTCIQCHSEGAPLAAPAGRAFSWPVGFQMGRDLRDFWQLNRPSLGRETTQHFADGTGRENRMQGNDYVQSVMYRRGVTCFTCHDPHGSGNRSELTKSARTLCLTCHGPASPNGPHAPTIEAHTHHAAGSTGSECLNCHMPAIQTVIGDSKVRSHTFRFIPPSDTDALGVPNPCTTCHSDRTTAWASGTLRQWPEFSAWRVGQ
jgi:predicted CXXCH cytochrome family protein